MPFDFFGSLDFDVSNFEAIDVGSVVDVGAVEFLSPGDLTSFNVPYEDIAGFGGYEIAGTFAGDAAYNDFFNAGGFLDNPAAVSDFTYNEFFNQGGFISGADVARTPGFGFPDVLEDPVGRTFGQQVQSFATQVQTDFTGFVKGAQQALQAYNKVAPLVNVVTAALKIPNPINALIQPFQQAVGAASLVADTAGSVRYVANAASTAGSTTSSSGTGYRPVAGGAPVVDSVAPRSVEEIAAGAPGVVADGQITNAPVLVITPDGAPVQVLPTPGQIVTSAGVPADAPFRELSDAETRALIARNIDPRLVNSIDSGLVSTETYDQALAAATDLAEQEQRLVTEREELKIRQGNNLFKIQELEEELQDPTLSQRSRDEIALELINLQAENGELAQLEFDVQQRVVETRQQLTQADAIIAATDASARSAPQPVTGGIPVPIGAQASDVRPVARPSLNVKPGDYPSGITQQTYNAALLTQAELSPEVERLRQERNALVSRLGSNDQAIRNLESQLSNPELSQEQRDEIARELIVLQAENGELEAEEARVTEQLTETGQQLAEANATISIVNASAQTGPLPLPAEPGSQYQTVYNPQNQTWSIRDVTTGLTIAANLTQNQTLAAAARLGVQLTNLQLNTATTADVFAGLSDEEILARRNPNNLSDEEVIARQNSITAGLRDAARNQQSIRSLRNNKAQSTDWRVRLRLAPNSTYLYNDTTLSNSVLAPLKATDGVIFPYTPSIDTAYKANYDTYDLVHSNYRGYFYKNSYVDIINLRATFTAQDTNEANYLLAVIHFFRSVTKMFYGKDTQRGSPPPLVYLNGYGNFQFNEHPCVVSQFNYQLPPDVDYIRAQSVLSNNTNLQLARLRNTIANNPLAYSVNRLLNSKLLPGALDFRPPIAKNPATDEPTYVPTKMEISIALLPVQSRSNISQNFSVKEFANGNLLKGGYW